MKRFQLYKSIYLNYALICTIWIVWYTFTSLSTLTNKKLLSLFPYSLTVTVNQLLHTNVYCFLISKTVGHLSLTEIFDRVKPNIKSFIILGFMNGASIACFHFGLSILSAAYIHTSMSFFLL